MRALEATLRVIGRRRHGGGLTHGRALEPRGCAIGSSSRHEVGLALSAGYLAACGNGRCGHSRFSSSCWRRDLPARRRTRAELLARIAPGVIWAMALFALLSVDRLFHADYQDGASITSCCVGCALVRRAREARSRIGGDRPAAASSPRRSSRSCSSLPPAGIGTLAARRLLSGRRPWPHRRRRAGLTLGARRSGLLMPLLVLPLYVPVLVFGAASVDAAVSACRDPMPTLALLAAIGAVAARRSVPGSPRSRLRQGRAHRRTRRVTAE